MLLFVIACSLCFIDNVVSVNNGLGITPPMGWRSWNAYHEAINQGLMTQCIDAVVDTSRKINGTSSSLADIGYNRVGVDDYWQLCNASFHTSKAHYFHNDTAPNGWALVNLTRFPDLSSFVEYGHNKNVLIGWYFNNCGCNEHNIYPANEVNDVLFLRKYGFDGIKLDGCSSSKNITNWQHLINITNPLKPLLTENCHNSPNYATLDWCPMNFFRSSGDINPSYPNIIGINLQSTIIYQDYPNNYISRPGCWAYPDMLEVGNIQNQYNASQNDMDQSHFSAWVVTSSPLILGFDLTNNQTLDRVWNVVTNYETIAVSQNWAGHPGRQIAKANYTIEYNNMPQFYDRYGELSNDKIVLFGYEIWAKPQPNNKWAVLLLNNDGYYSHDITVQFKDIPWNSSQANIRDIVNHKDLGTVNGDSYTVTNIPPFGSSFLLFS